jgi:hypothetical protein
VSDETMTPSETLQTAETPTEAAPAEPQAAEASAADPLESPTILGGDEQPTESDGADAEPEAPAAPPETYELDLPEGVTLDAEALEVATPVLRDLGLTNEQASKLAPLYLELSQKIAARRDQQIIADVVAQRQSWAEAATADPELGGSEERFEQTKQVAAKFIDDFGGAEFRQFLTETGLGNHPEMIRIAYRAGQAISEDARAFRASDAPPAPKTLGQIFYGNDYERKT